jgi:hypothetical protein
VIVKILKPEEMPVDEAGNRADIIMDSGSTINRKNISRAYEMYFSAAARDVTKNFLRILGLSQMSELKATKEVAKLASTDPGRIEEARAYLAGFYSIVSPRQYEFFTSLSPEGVLEWFAGIVNENIVRIYMPTDNEPEPADIVKQLEKHYRPTYGPVTYIGNSGRRVVTHDKIRIAPLYMMLLEQIGDNGSSVAYGKLQHFGVLSPVTRHEKYSSPNHNSPVRTIGETEGRIFSSYVGREGTAEMMDRSNNPQTHRHVVWNVLNAPQPTNIEKVVDRTVISLGGAKPIQLVKHVGMCSGWKPVYKKPQSFNR